jgi:hypothetical protein
MVTQRCRAIESGPDALVHPEDIGGVVSFLHRSEALVALLAIGCADALLALVAEEVDVHASAGMRLDGA